MNTMKLSQKTKDDGSYIIDADTELTELFEKLEIENLPETNYSTVGGLIFERAEELCEVGDVIRVDTIDEQIDDHGNFISKPITLVFTILETESNKITKAKLEIETTSTEEPKEGETETDSETTE